MAKPKNLSENPKGFNSDMFKSDRAVRRGFLILGYGVNPCIHKVPGEIITRFQRDYNKCADRFGGWGNVSVNGKLNKETLNGLEHAIRMSKKKENRDGTPSARSWQSLCSDRQFNCIYNIEFDGEKRSYSQTDSEEAKPKQPAGDPGETSFVEVLPNGSAKLRNIHTDDALRCNIINFELHGDVVFAVVGIPPQGDLPGGRSESTTCPCLLGRER